MATLTIAQLPQVLQDYRAEAAVAATAYNVTQATIDAVDALYPGLPEDLRPALPAVDGVRRALLDRLVPRLQRVVTVALLLWYDIFLNINGNGPLTVALCTAFLDALIIFAGDNGTTSNDPDGDVFIPDGAGGDVDVPAADFWEIIKNCPSGRTTITVRKYFTSFCERAASKGIAFRWGAKLGLNEEAADVSFDFNRGLNQYKIKPAHRRAGVNSATRAIESSVTGDTSLAHRERLATNRSQGFDI